MGMHIFLLTEGCVFPRAAFTFGLVLFGLKQVGPLAIAAAVVEDCGERKNIPHWSIARQFNRPDR